VEVLVSGPAKEYVIARGGAVYVRAHSHRCCSGTLTLLDIWTKPPKDVTGFVAAASDDIEVKFSAGFSGQPHQLVIELRGMWRQHLVAYWDGCAYKI
jgi:hypothetical protein